MEFTPQHRNSQSPMWLILQVDGLAILFGFRGLIFDCPAQLMKSGTCQTSTLWSVSVAHLCVIASSASVLISLTGVADYVHPTARIASTDVLVNGIIVAPFVCVGALTAIGENVSLNMHSVIGHDVVIGNASIVSPDSALLGGVPCKEATCLGSGTVVYPCVEVGPFCRVSSGSVLKSSSGGGCLVHGNPASGRLMFPVEVSSG